MSSKNDLFSPSDIDAGVLIGRSSPAHRLPDGSLFAPQELYTWPSPSVRALDPDLPPIFLAWQSDSLQLSADMTGLALLELWFHLCPADLPGENIQGYAYRIQIERSSKTSYSATLAPFHQPTAEPLQLKSSKADKLTLSIPSHNLPGWSSETHRIWRVALLWQPLNKKTPHYWPLHSKSALTSSSHYWARLYWQDPKSKREKS